MTIAYDYGYNAFKREREQEERSIDFSEMRTICEHFKSFRKVHTISVVTHKNQKSYL